MMTMLRRILVLVTGLLFGLGVSPEAHARFVFPYNHPDLEWYSIETEHFVVHYPMSKESKEEGNPHALTSEWSARKMIKAAEDVWEPMCAEFNYYLKEKVHIVLLNQSDDLAGFTIPAWDWVEISANPGGTFYRGRGRMEWFSDVFVHEFAHVVSLKANAAMAEGVQGVVIGGLYRNGINADLPTKRPILQHRGVAAGAEVVLADTESVFWTEGGAEFWSDNTGYNWWTTSRDQNIRMTVLEDRLLRYDEWHTRFGKQGWGDSERYYQQGYSFGLYLRQRFGAETYARFAVEAGRKWRFEWVTVIKDVLGISAEELYNDWVAYITQQYTAKYDEVKAGGEVVGREMLSSFPEWDFQDPDGRDEWEAQGPWVREKKKERTGTYQWEPRISADGRFIGWLNRASIKITAGGDDQFPALTGYVAGDPQKLDDRHYLSSSFPADFEHGWDFIPGRDAVVATGREDMQGPVWSDGLGFTPEFDGYDWKRLWIYEMPTREKKVGKRRVQTRERKRFLSRELYPDGAAVQIPNTERGTDPSMHPDGERLSFFQYDDGTMNLKTINLDGTAKRDLTHFTDGTWLQVSDWSPDGKQLVFAIFKNYQQNLYIINADGTGIRPIMVDAWEELDAHWARDGKIYFSADPTGIFNIYSYEVATGRFRQITNVIGGAQSPQLTTEGNLVYSYYTAHGWKIYGLPGDQFLNAPADHHFNTDFDMNDVEDGLAFEEDLTYLEAVTTPYKASKAFMPPTGVPMFKLQTGNRDLGLMAGGQVYAQDYVEKYAAMAQVMLGESSYVLGRLWYQDWYPTFVTGVFHYRGKNSRGFMVDEDDDKSTTDDQTIWELKSAQSQSQVFGGGFYSWNNAVSVGLIGSYMNFNVKGISDPAFVEYLHAYESSLFVNFVNVSGYYARGPNPYFGRQVDLDWTHGWTDVTYPTFGGVAVDDGEVLDEYQYNRYQVRWTELIQMPSFWGIPVFEKARAKKHVFQLDAQLGYLDRNVDVNDEFRAGGQHPSNLGYSSVQPNTQFAGYPGWSLSGETMAIFNVAYRFPLSTYGFWRYGPVTTNGIYMQVGGTAGNLWSFRPPEDASESYRSQYDDRIAYDPADVEREIPFLDVAYKNGNRMLYDAFTEIRVASVFRDGMGWNSFVRLAYGFNEVRGYGDVDGDGIFDTSETGVGDELSAETEPAGWRVYLGLGTGW